MIIFTFHHVSIKTQTLVEIYKCPVDSHSTMYLLKHLAYAENCSK